MSEPIPMLLTCPTCCVRHVDVGEFATKVHHTHACQSCGHVWRPAVVPTVGVQFLPGFRNEPREAFSKPSSPLAAGPPASCAPKLTCDGCHQPVAGYEEALELSPVEIPRWLCLDCARKKRVDLSPLAITEDRTPAQQLEDGDVRFRTGEVWVWQGPKYGPFIDIDITHYHRLRIVDPAESVPPYVRPGLAYGLWCPSSRDLCEFNQALHYPATNWGSVERAQFLRGEWSLEKEPSEP